MLLAPALLMTLLAVAFQGRRCLGLKCTTCRYREASNNMEEKIKGALDCNYECEAKRHCNSKMCLAYDHDTEVVDFTPECIDYYPQYHDEETIVNDQGQPGCVFTYKTSRKAIGACAACLCDSDLCTKELGQWNKTLNELTRGRDIISKLNSGGREGMNPPEASALAAALTIITMALLHQ